VITPLPFGGGDGGGADGCLYVRLPLLGCLHRAWWGLSLTLGSFFSHRAHRVHGVFWRTFRAHRTPSAYREHRAFQLS